ncbi:MAG: hypothetical protein DMF59_07380 [Acidobacteria bacterium]|nr:MAG: hypothetical protein DMF59_07380 [Acidobacteriota bacterium]
MADRRRRNGRSSWRCNREPHGRRNRQSAIPRRQEQRCTDRASRRAGIGRIFAEAQTNPDLRGMGTTASALVIVGTQGWFAHVGDSRIYMVRGDAVKQLTEDHSLVATMVREGLLTAQEAETHPRRNVLQRSIGVGEDVEIDIRGPIELQENDTFVLCSDGLHGLVKENEIKEVAKRPIQQAANEFVALALERGAPDNVTVIVARVVRAEQIGEDTLTDEGERALFDDTVKDHEVASLRQNH